MLTLDGSSTNRFCDGLARRNFLRVGALGLGSCSLTPKLLQAATTGAVSRTATEKSVVMIYLPGGPTQHETFDPKPSASMPVPQPSPIYRGDHDFLSMKIGNRFLS